MSVVKKEKCVMQCDLCSRSEDFPLDDVGAQKHFEDIHSQCEILTKAIQSYLLAGPSSDEKCHIKDTIISLYCKAVRRNEPDPYDHSRRFQKGL